MPNVRHRQSFSLPNGFGKHFSTKSNGFWSDICNGNIYLTFEGRVACVVGAKGEGGWGGKEKNAKGRREAFLPLLFPTLLPLFVPPLHFPFDACHALKRSPNQFCFRITPRKYDIIHGTNSTPNKGATFGAPLEGPESDTAESTSKETAEEGTTLFERQTRLSLTLRKIRHTPCNCAFLSQCDSQTDNKNSSEASPSSDVPRTFEEAQNLEKIHVHEVYEKIAPHFSGTRHSPWPKIAEFLREQPVGSLVADVGCGNGKYLGINDNIFKTGSDRSFNLAAICRERGFSVIVCDILSLPYR